MYDLLILWPQDEALLHLLLLSSFNISFLFFASFKLSFPTDFLTWLLTCFVITTSNKNPQAKLTLHNLTWLYIIWFCEHRKQFISFCIFHSHKPCKLHLWGRIGIIELRICYCTKRSDMTILVGRLAKAKLLIKHYNQINVFEIYCKIMNESNGKYIVNIV